MGSCFSTSKVSGSNSSTSVNNRRSSAAAKPPASGAPESVPRKQESSNNDRNRRARESHKSQQQKKPSHHNLKSSSKRPTGAIPCGKRTDFGYDKDFDKRYTIGKLLGHGQFGYTYVAIDKSNGDRVAVKKIDKGKVRFFDTFFLVC